MMLDTTTEERRAARRRRRERLASHEGDVNIRGIVAAGVAAMTLLGLSHHLLLPDTADAGSHHLRRPLETEAPFPRLTRKQRDAFGHHVFVDHTHGLVVCAIPKRIDDYAAHFHHHPWRDAQLALTPRLLKRLGEGVGGTADDGDESSEADAERAIAANDYVGSVSEAPRCVVLIDARGAVSEALKNCDVGAARRVILRMRRICDDAKLGETALDAHWEADQLRCSFGRCGIALAFCARVVAIMGPGCRAALRFSEDAVATEYPSGRPHGEAWNVLCELVEAVPADEPRCCVSDACRDRLQREGLDDDDEAWTRIEGGYLRAPWPSLSLPRHSCDVVHQEPVERVVVVAMLYFDASLKSTSRLYVERRRALDVLEAALTSKGGRRAMGSDTLYIFDACVSRALDAVLASRKALEGIKAGFGVARGPVYEGEVLAGSCVGVAARLCAQHGVLLSKPAAEALDPDHVSHLRTVPVFLQGSDSSGVLEEFCQVLC